VQNCSIKKIGIKLNKSNEYRDQIQYKTLILTHETRLDWNVDIFSI